MSDDEPAINRIRLPQSTIDARKKLRDERAKLTAEDLEEEMRAARSAEMPTLREVFRALFAGWKR